MLPLNLNVSLDFVSGNIEILGKRNSLFPSGPVIKCLMFALTGSRKVLFVSELTLHLLDDDVFSKKNARLSGAREEIS